MLNTAQALERALAHHQAGRLGEALVLYRQILEVEPRNAHVLFNLGAALLAGGEYRLALDAFDRGLAVAPQVALAHFSRGTALHALEDQEAAAAAYREALRLDPRCVEAMVNLGDLLRSQNRLDEALTWCQRAVQLKPEIAEAHNNLATVYSRQGRFEEAVQACQRALELKPDFAEATNNLGILLAQQGREAEAAMCYRRALTFQPQNAVWQLGLLSLCPTVFESTAAIEDYRRQLFASLAAFDNSQLGLEFPYRATTGCMPSFNLQAHGHDERPVREAYARLLGDCFPREVATGSSGRPRIGIVVSDPHETIFLRSMRGVMERIDRDRFELTIVGSERGVGIMRPAIDNPQLQYLGVRDRLDSFVAALRAARFDLLYYWEVATDNINFLLPFYRLAPVQCTSWGIQVTSGSPQMDYYISSELTEPAEAQEHYTEKLLLARTLLSYHERVALPANPQQRSDFGIDSRQHVYLCAQKLGKFHPDFDALLAGILRRDAEGTIVCVEERNGAHVAAQLRRRFAKTMPDVADRVRFLPPQALGDYLALIAAADVLLDPLYYGGTTSTYDGLSLNQPVVTLPSRFHRGRYALACYKKMGLMDCVAATPEQYVDIAVKLGTDSATRSELIEKIRRSSGVLFEDMLAVREHERIFGELVALARAGRD